MHRSLQPLLISLVAALPALGQFQAITTDQSGSRAWFSSALVQSGADQHGREKIFRVDAQGNVELVEQQPFTGQYRLLNPQVSSDGRRLAYWVDVYCPPGITCRPIEPDHSVVSTEGQPDREFAGHVEMSRNGRYLLRHSYGYFGPTDQVELIDLETGATVPWALSGFLPMPGAIQVTANGAALVHSSGLWVIDRKGSFSFVPSADFTPSPDDFDWDRFGYPWATIDDSGARVALTSTSGVPAVVLGAPGIESEFRVLAGPEQGASGPVFSADGTQVLFLSEADITGANPGLLRQAWIADVGSGAIRQATDDPAGIAEATLSGDGAVVWAVTFAGRIIRVELDQGHVDEVVPQTTLVPTDPFGYPFLTAPGSLFTVTGRGLAPAYEASGMPLATELAGVQLLLDGEPLPLLYVAPTEIRAQIPWTLTGVHTVTLAPTRSPFDSEDNRRIPVRVQDARPLFEFTAEGRPVVAHGDFRGLVTDADPAKPGEVLHLFLTGLGAVEPPVATGEPAPLDRLSVLNEPVVVFLGGDLLPAPSTAEVLFAGLAPGMVGVYQVSIRLPAGITRLPLWLSISVQTGDQNAFVTIPGGF